MTINGGTGRRGEASFLGPQSFDRESQDVDSTVKDLYRGGVLRIASAREVTAATSIPWKFGLGVR
jgi:hypothetical protein